MDKNEQQKLKEIMLAEKKTIENELNGFADKDPQIKGNYKARFDKSDSSDTDDEKARSITDYEEGRAVEQNLELRLREINETIEKIDNGTYGICSKCMSPIDQKRLAVIPVARFCVGCAKKAHLL